MTRTADGTRPKRRWWLELEVVLLVALVFGAYFVRLTDLTVRGEESRRAQIANEMIWSGDWVVPRQQGELYLTRPPLQNWAIAWIGQMRESVDAVALRLPSVIAMLLTTFVIYGYARSFLSRPGAFASAACFLTLPQVMELGRLGESDALLTLGVCGALFSWHWGWTRRWPPWLCWVIGYAFAAFGAMVKGPQPPCYFAGPVFLYLILDRNWRALFTPAHALGLFTFIALIAPWQIAFYRELGLSDSILVWTYEVRHASEAEGFFEHLIMYPIRILLGSWMPWVFLLLPYTNRSFRRAIQAERPHVRFMTIALLVAAPTVWLVPGAATRYFMAMYPCVAILIGVAVHHSFADPKAQPHWRRFALGVGVALAITMPIGLYVMRAMPSAQQTLPFSLVFAAVSLCAAWALLWSRSSGSLLHARVGIMAVSGWLVMFFVGFYTNTFINNSNDAAGAMVALREKLPADVELVSLDEIHHLFAYHYNELIPIVPWPETPAGVPQDLVYFCFERTEDHGELPFEWEEIAVYSCDRSNRLTDRPEVIVGRRSWGEE